MLKERLLEDMKEAMKTKDVIRKNVIQMVRAAILQVEKDGAKQLSEDEILAIMAKEVKKRKDSLPDYEKSGRADLVDNITKEIHIIEEYLPEAISEEELEKEIKSIIQEIGATSMKEMGAVMKLAKERIGIRADGKQMNEMVKKILG